MIKLKEILKKKKVDEKMSVAGSAARDILYSILPKTMFAKGDDESQKKHKEMTDDLVKTLNNFYKKYNIDKKIVL